MTNRRKYVTILKKGIFSMNKKRIRILAIILVLVSCFSTLASIFACIYSKEIFMQYNFFMKDFGLSLWIASYFLISLLNKKRSKKMAILASLIFSILFTVQMIFIYNAYNFIEIQHYFSWEHNISYLEVISADVLYDFSSLTFKYFMIFAIMFVICIFGAIISSNKFNQFLDKIISKMLNYDDFDDDFDDDLELYEFISMNKQQPAKPISAANERNFRQNPSQGKLNSRARSAKRKLKK